MNNREIVNSILKESIKNINELYKKENIDEYEFECKIEAYELSLEWFENKFEYNLKKYNRDKEKAYDNFILEKTFIRVSRFCGI